MNGELGDKTSRKFGWGLLLVWAPFVLLFAPMMFNMFHGMSERKAIGMGAVAGIVAEAFTTFGLIVVLAFEGIAIAFLVRTVSRRHLLRTFFSVLSICCSGFMLFALGGFLWLVLIFVPRHHP